MTNTQFENEEEIQPVGYGGGFHGGHGEYFLGGGYYNPFIVPIVVTDDGRYYQYPHPYPYPYYPYPYSYPYY
ncbi:hypothetical protein [Paenibacillus sp. RC67]|uniref:hypothetical protein n=1 Tax=Paenibacillus sp. RC67 TaxID=3039392 RepID=UPI0024ACA44C|nr:hypothetical protein [Paenibacillus sp. RC67]